jgi:hypothetical protein
LGVFAGEAVPGTTSYAGATGSAGRPPSDYYEIAGRDVVHTISDLLHNSRCLMTKEEREFVIDRAFTIMKIGMANSARLHTYQRFARAGVGDENRLNRNL